MEYLERLAARRRFGMRPGLENMERLMDALGGAHRRVKSLHVAGTNGKGAVCAILDSCLRSAGAETLRYTSPHLVRLNERFLLDGACAPDALLDGAAARVEAAADALGIDLTFFEALTAVAFLVADEEDVDFAVLETGLGGRLDATNICAPSLCCITRIGLDHCDWLGDTPEKIAAEKAGIIKPGVPVVLGRNTPEVVEVVKARAAKVGAPFVYAPDAASESEIPDGFALAGSFNRENAVTALAALKTLFAAPPSVLPAPLLAGFGNVVWPGRFQRAGRFTVDGAHNPPAARALVAALDAERGGRRFDLVAGFCSDKDVAETLAILRPVVRRAFAVRTNNPRSMAPDALADAMRRAGMDAAPCATLADALAATGDAPTLVCGSLFLAGEALVALGAYPYPSDRFDPSERLR